MATHNSSPTSWYRSAWTALTVKRAETIVSIMDATVQWTVFRKAYKAATMAVRYIWVIARHAKQCADTILTSKNSMAPQHLCLPCRLLRRISGSFVSGNKLSPSIKHGCGGHMFSCLTRTASKTVVAGPYSLIPNLQIWFLNANWTYEA